MNIATVLLVAAILAPFAAAEFFRAHQRQPFFSRRPVSGRWLQAVLSRDLNSNLHDEDMSA